MPWQLRMGWLIVLFLAHHESPAQTSGATGFGFNRIIPGWTNYSTAFSTTHDLSLDGEFATVASFYTPPATVLPLEFSVIMIWFGSGNQRLDFGDFVFQIHLWSNLEEFIGNPRAGDVATLDFAAPTGGSTTSPDAVTRGGRPAYLLRFNLADASLTLTQCHAYVIGVTARTTSIQAGELYVPTAPHDGPSDVQAGNIVPFGWLYLLNAGGQTIYSGQLATALAVQPVGESPRIEVRRTGSDVCLVWPNAAGCYRLESSDDLASPLAWSPVEEPPLVEAELTRLCLPASGPKRWYRLVKESDSRLKPP